MYGIDLRREDRFLRHFRAWAKQRNVDVIRRDEEIHRFRFETFLQQQKLLPKKWGAVRLGMKWSSLNAVLARLAEADFVFAVYPHSDQFVAEAIDQDFLGLFDSFRFRTFRDHNSFCRRLHQAFQEQFDVPVVSYEACRLPPRFLW